MNDLITLSVSAISTVFFILVMLAAIMRLIMAVFPEKGKSLDQALIAAMTGACSVFFKGSRIKRIEEIK